jgi:hypothetical protein
VSTELPAEALLVFGNTADSIAAEKALLGAGISARVMPLPNQIGTGCGICLAVDRADLGQAGETPGVNIRDIYTIQPGPAGNRYELLFQLKIF